MSGGQLVVLDRLGRDVKRYPLPEGLATIGSDPACNIRVMLSSVSPHHATVVVHANQTVVRNVSTGETLVNGQPVSVAALRHKDRIELGGRVLRWEYSDAAVERPLAPQPVVYSRGRGRAPAAGRSAGSARSQRARRASAAAPGPRRSPAVQLRLEMTHRASMPGGVGGKQVAIVQPQRRATAEQNDHSLLRQNISVNNRPRATKSDGGSSPEPSAILADGDKSKRKSSRPVTSSPITLQGTTKATLWIESRKSSPRKTVKPATPTSAPAPRRRAASATKSTPLRLAVLKRHRTSLTKIQAPREIDPTKQAAIMLMTGRTPRPPAVLVKRTGSLRLTPKQPAAPTPRRRSETHSVTLLEINDSPQPPSSAGFRRSPPVLASPKKSALKDPSVKKSSRKTDSIKFDLSNLDNYEQSQDVFMVSDVTHANSYDANVSSEDENVSLHYDTSTVTPSPRRSIHSRSSRILESTLGTSAAGRSSTSSQQSTLTPGTPRNRKSSRGSILVQKVLQNSANESSKRYSTRTTKTVSDQSYDSTVESAFRTRTLSPRSPTQSNMESYSIVDLVSADSNDSRSSSVYDSVRSRNSSNAVFGTPQNSVGRKTRSTIDPSAITSSTPYVGKFTARRERASSSPNLSRNRSVNNQSQISRGTRRSKSLTTPENTQPISLNATRVSRGPRSRSRINDSELLLISTVTDVEDSSPKSSKRLSRNDKSISPLQNARTSARKTRLTVNVTPSESDEGMNTPENKGSPQEAGTPVLSIQSLLDSSLGSSMSSSRKPPKKGRMSKRNTVGGIQKKGKSRPAKSKSLSFVARSSGRGQSKDSSAAWNMKTRDALSASGGEDAVTPKSAVKLVPEDVKNKHSTAKKPQSKRSIIDDLNDSDIVKQLFNSPVKRKLSQSMTEYSRRQLFDDVDVVAARRPTRHTVANSGRTPERSPLERTEAYSPGVFVSPLNTPDRSPNLTGIKRLFENQTPEDGVRGDKNSTRTSRHRRSIKNDLTRVSGVKNIFARSPRNRLSNVRVKELFAAPQKDDLSRVSGVKTLLRTKTPNNDLRDVRGVKKLFSGSPVDDLRNVSGVKNMLRRNSPRNDLSDVRGVRKIFRQEKETADGLSNVSGVEELFNESNQSLRGTNRSHRRSSRSHGASNKSHVELNRSQSNAEASFDKLLGKPPIRAVYSKTFTKKFVQKPKLRHCKSVHIPVGEITNNLEEWLDQELKKSLQRDRAMTSSAKASKSNVSLNVTRELQRLATDTVAGEAPLCISRVRNSTAVVSGANASVTHTTITSVQDKSDQRRSASQVYSARKLPIKKRLWPSVAPSGAGLPLKKRSVVHSTPVKGLHGRMDASELSCGRVSPITASDQTAQNALHLVSVQQQETDSAKGLARTKSKIGLSKIETPKVSLKKIRASQTPEQSSTRSKALRNRKTDNTHVSNARKQRPSLVVAKKAPALSPQPGTKATRRKVDNKNVENVKGKAKDDVPVKSLAVTPKKRTTRRQKLDNSKDNKVETSIKTPKRAARGKVQRASLVVRKPLPTMKPVAPKGKANIQTEQKRRTRIVTTTSKATSKAKAEQKTEPIEPRGARTRRTAEVIAKPKGKQTKVTASPPAKIRPGEKTKETKVEEKSIANNKTRGRKLEKDIDVVQGNKKGANLKGSSTKGKKTEPELDTEKAETVKATNTRNRAGQKQNKIVEVPKTRGRKTEVTSAQTKHVSQVAATRGKKTKAVEEVLEESKRSRGKKVETQDNKQIKGKRGQKTKIVEDKNVSEVAPTRGKRTKANEVVQENKRTRGKSDTNSTQSVAKDQKSKAKAEDKSRKRKSTIESDIPSKVRKTKNEDMTEAKGRGRKAVEVVKEAKEVRETAKKPVEKMHMTRRRATADKTTGGEATAGRAGRGRQATASSSESQAAGRKRKSVADTSDKAGKGAGRKQPATKKSKVAESPKQRTRGRAAPAEGPKRAIRARR